MIDKWQSSGVCLVFLLSLTLGCATESNELSETAVDGATPASFNSSDTKIVEFHLPDMMCAEGCGTKTKEILTKQPGVKEVLVSFDTKSASVVVEEGTFDPQGAIAALVDHGFEQSTLKQDTHESATLSATDPSATE